MLRVGAFSREERYYNRLSANEKPGQGRGVDRCGILLIGGKGARLHIVAGKATVAAPHIQGLFAGIVGGAMAFQSVPQTAEIVIRYEANQVTSNNVLQAKLTGGYDLADLVVLADVVDLSIAADWLPLQTQDTAYISTTVRGLEFANDVETVNNNSAAAGGVLSKGLPGNATFSVKKSSGLTGRTARGRIYWIGLPAAALANNENQLLSVSVSDIEAALEATRADIAATIWDPVIVSRFLDGLPRATGATFPWIAVVAVNENVDSQRRRLTT